MYPRDVHTLVHDVLGHERCVVAGGDIGGVVGVDLVHRFGDFVERFCFFNTVPPAAIEEYAAAGLDYGSFSALSDGPTGDYRELQGARPDELAAMLPTDAAPPAVDRGHVHEPAVGVAGHVRTRRHVDFMTEPFADEARLRAGLVGVPARARPADDASRRCWRARSTCRRSCSTAPTTTWSATTSCRSASVAFTDRIGPLLIPGAGHFLQWERADIFNPLLISVFGS